MSAIGHPDPRQAPPNCRAVEVSQKKYKVIQKVTVDAWRAMPDDDEHFVYAIAL